MANFTAAEYPAGQGVTFSGVIDAVTSATFSTQLGTPTPPTPPVVTPAAPIPLRQGGLLFALD